MKKNQVKKRNWAGVIYTDSAPSDWIELLKLKGLPFAISPLHNKDIETNGEEKKVKKEHYHIILCFGSPTTFNNVKSIFEELNQPIPIPLESVKGYYRYFTHKDNAEKFQYNEKDIQLFNGFNVDDILNSFEVFQSLKEIQKIINDNEIIEYCTLLDFLITLEDSTLWNVASSHTLFLNTYITSKRHKKYKIIK